MGLRLAAYGPLVTSSTGLASFTGIAAVHDRPIRRTPVTASGQPMRRWPYRGPGSADGHLRFSQTAVAIPSR